MCSDFSCHKSGAQCRNFYGRFKGKALSAKQSETLRNEFAKYSIKNICKNLETNISVVIPVYLKNC